MRTMTSSTVGVLLLGMLAGCGGVRVAFNPPEKVTWSPPWGFGSLEFSFVREQERPVDNEAALKNLIAESGGKHIVFSAQQFSIDEPPKGCAPFVSAKLKDIDLENQGVWKAIQARVQKTKDALGDIPDDMAMSVAMYESSAFRSACGEEIAGQIGDETKINGWRLHKGGSQAVTALGQGVVTLQPHVLVVAIRKDKLALRERIKPSVLNLFVAKHRFEAVPNYHTVVADPRTKAFVSTYSFDLENVAVKGKSRDLNGAGIFRYYDGKDYLYIVSLFAFAPQTSADQWRAYVQYLDTFRYVKPEQQETASR
jgi:hypothetical protein